MASCHEVYFTRPQLSHNPTPVLAQFLLRVKSSLPYEVNLQSHLGLLYAVVRSQQAVVRSQQAVVRNAQAVVRSQQAVVRNAQAVVRSQ
ncbi:MAG: hypothetical protein KME30_16455 [Iphinoe sp. HA4291-MV1]|nr:hypothetical protein [Iphinoe sp. HA4291-MV1]